MFISRASCCSNPRDPTLPIRFHAHSRLSSNAPRAHLRSACSVAAPTTSLSHDEFDETSASRISTSTNQLITAVGEYQRATGAHRNAAAAKLRLAARERRNLLLNAIERQPGLTLRQSLPTGLTMSLPADVRDLIEQEVELTGRVTGLHGDDMRNKVSTRKYFLEVTPEPHSVRYRLHAADLPDHPGHEHPAAPFVGKAVTVRALKIDGQLLLTGEGAIEAADGTGTTSNITTVSGGTVSGTQNTLVLLANFQDKALSCSATQVNNLMFGPSGSVGDLYRETSASAVTFSVRCMDRGRSLIAAACAATAHGAAR